MILNEDFLRVKWLDPEKHLTQLVQLHAECFPQEGWQTKDFRKFVNKIGRNNILKVLEDDNRKVYGSLLYTLTSYTCRIRRVAVFKEFRRKGLGTFMVHSLTGPRSPIRRKTFIAKVRESNFPAQAMFHGRLKFVFDPAAKRDQIDNEDIYVFAFEKTPFSADDLVCKEDEQG